LEIVEVDCSYSIQEQGRANEVKEVIVCSVTAG
jgi:hypothetical protein